MSVATATAITAKLNATGDLTAIVGNRIYYGQAPDNAIYPFVIVTKQSGTKRRAFQSPEAFRRDVWLIKTVDRSTSAKRAFEAAEAIDTAFDGGSLTITGKTLADLHHVSDVSYVESHGDQIFHHVGGNYAVVTT